MSRRPPPPAPELQAHAPYADALPAPLVFRTARLPGRASYPQHCHPWGEFVYAFDGVIEVKLADAHIVAPPGLGIWLPPGMAHRGLNRRATVHSSLYLDAALCTALPAQACAMDVGPLARAMLEHLRAHPHALPPTPAERRLLRALADRLAEAQVQASFLPRTDDARLGAVLQALDEQPGDERTLAQWADAVHSTERTLSRRCRQDLGMSFAEWRQRLRVLKALPRLEAGEAVEAVALDLGYASASAFITMFRRSTGRTPDAWRRGRDLSR